MAAPVAVREQFGPSHPVVDLVRSPPGSPTPRRSLNIIMVRALRQADAEIRPVDWFRLALWLWTPGIGFAIGVVLASRR